MTNIHGLSGICHVCGKRPTANQQRWVVLTIDTDEVNAHAVCAKSYSEERSAGRAPGDDAEDDIEEDPYAKYLRPEQELDFNER